MCSPRSQYVHKKRMADPSDHQGTLLRVNREELYEQVWSEPMLKVAARFAVFASEQAAEAHYMPVA